MAENSFKQSGYSVKGVNQSLVNGFYCKHIQIMLFGQSFKIKTFVNIILITCSQFNANFYECYYNQDKGSSRIIS